MFYRPEAIVMARFCKSNATQYGAILVISLVLLTVMSLIGVAAMQSTIMQERMAGNSRDLNLAFEAAEAGIREGETWLFGLTAMPSPRGCTASSSPFLGVWDDNGTPDALFCAAGAASLSYTDIALWTNPAPRISASENPAFGNLAGIKNSPKFVIEFTGHNRDSQNLGQQQDLSNNRAMYRVTARGTGGTDTAQSYVQTTFAKRF